MLFRTDDVHYAWSIVFILNFGTGFWQRWGHLIKIKDVKEELMKFPSERLKQLFHAVSPARRLPVIIHSSELVNDLWARRDSSGFLNLLHIIQLPGSDTIFYYDEPVSYFWRFRAELQQLASEIYSTQLLPSRYSGCSLPRAASDKCLLFKLLTSPWTRVASRFRLIKVAWALAGSRRPKICVSTLKAITAHEAAPRQHKTSEACVLANEDLRDCFCQVWQGKESSWKIKGVSSAINGTLTILERKKQKSNIICITSF